MANYPLVESAFKALIPPSIGIKKRYEHHNFSKDRVTKRLEKGREHEGVDIWNLVLNKSEKRGLSRAEMDKNAGLFMIAGTETTATLVSGLTTLLLENSQAMKELTTEIRQAFETPADMSIEKCAALPYLNACLKEALRLYPPVATGRPRVCPPEGSTICGHYIPPGVGLLHIPGTSAYLSDNYAAVSRERTASSHVHLIQQFQGPPLLPSRALAGRPAIRQRQAPCLPRGTERLLGQEVSFPGPRCCLAVS
jgi:hypothetical protein